MRSRILRVAVVAVTLAVTLFGVPLALAVHALVYADERGELERLALRGAMSMSPQAAGGDPVELPATERSVQLGIFDASGRLVTGSGPADGDRAVSRALAGHVSDRSTDGYLVVAVPVTEGERVVAASRAASPRGVVQRRIMFTWLGMLGLALVAVACASLVAAAQARRINRPLEELERVAQELGAGNFGTRAHISGVGEIDRAGEALNRTGEALDTLLSRERAFSAYASHQLRTPLTSLRLGLDTALSTPGADLDASARDAMVAADHLSRTIDDVLALSRGAGSALTTVEVAGLLADVRARWHGPLAAAGRPLRIDEDQVPATATASAAAVRQILEVLLDNASRHGRGAVTVTARPAGGAVAIDVVDEGSTYDTPLLPVAGVGDGRTVDAGRPGSGRLGLALARSLAEAQGGRLVHARTEPRTRLTLLLQGPPAEGDGDDSGSRGDGTQTLR